MMKEQAIQSEFAMIAATTRWQLAATAAWTGCEVGAATAAASNTGVNWSSA